MMRRLAKMGRPRTIRARLIVVVTGLLLAALAVLGVTSIAILRQNLVAQAETTLYLSNSSAVTRVSDTLEQDGTLPEFDDTAIVMPPDGFLLVLSGEDPRLSGFFTRDYSYRPLTSSEIAQVSVAANAFSAPVTVPIDADGRYLVVASEAEAPDGTSYTVLTGVGLADADSVTTTYILWTALVALAVAVIAAATGYQLVKRELAPLEHVAEISRRVAATPLSSGEVAPQGRVPRDPRREGSETDQVVSGINYLLAHLESSLNARHLAEESMRRFLAEASHELRNPLASIRGYADFYADAPADPAEMAAALTRVGAEARRMSALVDDLLLLAKLDAGSQLKQTEVDLSTVVLETASDARFAFPEHSWRIVMPDDPISVVGDDAAIRQLLLNLVGNAGHHTPAGTTVQLSIEPGEHVTVLAVSDDGPGIPAEALPTLFDRFTQAGETTAVRKSSTVGLGLAIVQALATAMGYQVEVATTPAGTRFAITIPV